MKTTRFALGVPLFLLLCLGVAVQADHHEGSTDHTPDHVMFTPKEVKWVDAPPSLPPGAKLALLEGNPSASGPFTLRIRVPAHYRIPPHWHPADEHVTVISGTFYMGLGEQFDTSKGRALPEGGFAMMKTGTRHFAWTAKRGAVVQLHGIGPWGITYVDPKDDPRNK